MLRKVPEKNSPKDLVLGRFGSVISPSTEPVESWICGCIVAPYPAPSSSFPRQVRRAGEVETQGLLWPLLQPSSSCPKQCLSQACFSFFLFFFFLVFVSFLGPHPRHVEVPRLGGRIGAVATGLRHSHRTWDLSCICDLYHSSRQHQILNPLGKARNPTCSLTVPGWIR